MPLPSGEQTMPNIQTILLFVFTSGQICGSQIFGGQGPQGHGHGVPPPRGEFEVAFSVFTEFF